MKSTIPEVRAPRGTERTCSGWSQEAAMRMIMNNLDPDVAERPDELIVYGGRGQAARSWEAYDAIIAALQALEIDETLLVQSGKPIGVVRTTVDSPRVMIANSNLVPHWGNWDEFRRLEALGLTMYGQMTAGSWIYIGTQGILQGTYETFGAAAREHFDGTLKGKLVVTGGLGGMGGAQPLAATMAGASMLAIECQSDRIDMRLQTGYLDCRAETLSEKLQRHLGLPVELVDERYTSLEADRVLAGRKREKGRRDAVAAALLLQTWLDRSPRLDPEVGFE